MYLIEEEEERNGHLITYGSAVPRSHGLWRLACSDCRPREKDATGPISRTKALVLVTLMTGNVTLTPTASFIKNQVNDKTK